MAGVMVVDSVTEMEKQCSRSHTTILGLGEGGV